MWLKKEKKLLPILGAQTLSELATAMVSYALILWTYERTGAAFDISLLSVASYLPYVLGSALSGALIDRWPKKGILAACDTVSAAGTLLLLILLVSGNLQVGWIVCINICSGIGNAFHVPTLHALIGQAVSGERYTHVSGLLSFSSALVTAFSTFFASLLYASVGLVNIFLFDLLVYGIALAVLLRFVGPESSRGERREALSLSSFLEETRQGYRFLAGRRGLLWIIGSMCLMNFFSRITYENILPAMLLARSGHSETVLAVVNLAIGAGGILGGLYVSARPLPRDQVGLLYGAAGISFLFGDLLMAFGRGLPLWIPAALAASVPISFVAAAQQSILYRVVPNEMLGRVFAIRNAVQFSAIPAGILLGGALADYVFTPLAASGGEAGRLICWLFGATGGSGMAAMFSLTGFLGGLFCAMAFRSRGVQSLRKELNPEKWNPTAGEGN